VGQRIRIFIHSEPHLYPPTIHAANILAENGYSVELVGINYNHNNRIATHNNVRLIYIDTKRLGVGNIIQYIYSYVALSFMQLRRRAIWQFSYDPKSVGPVFISSILTASKWLYHNHDYYENPRGWHKIYKFIEQRSARYANVVSFPQLERSIKFKSKAKLRIEPLIVYNGPRSSWPNSNLKNDAYNTVETFSKSFKYILLYQGQFAKSYGLDTYIKCLANLPSNVGLVMIGRKLESDINQRFLDLARHIKVSSRLLLLDEINYFELPSIANMCHLGLGKLTSNPQAPINDYYLTTASNKISEYITLGLSVVLPTSDINLSFYQGKSFAVLCDPNNERNMALKMSNTLLDAEASLSAKNKAITVASEYHYDYQFQKILNIIKRD
jgi:hypothetical protein